MYSLHNGRSHSYEGASGMGVTREGGLPRDYPKVQSLRADDEGIYKAVEESLRNALPDIELIKKYQDELANIRDNDYGVRSSALQSLETELKDRGILSRVVPLSKLESKDLLWYHGWLMYRSARFTSMKQTVLRGDAPLSFDDHFPSRIVYKEAEEVEKELLSRLADDRLLGVLKETQKLLRR